MTQVADAFTRDANQVPITGLGLILKKSITFSALTTGAIGTYTLFTVSGNVSVNVFGLCVTDLTGSGTLEIGVADSTAVMCNQQSATAIDANEVWHDASLAVAANVASHERIIDQNIILTIASNTVTGGVVDIYCTWFPLDSNSTVIVA